MIRSYFGTTKDPFVIDASAPLLEHQQRHFDILTIHNQQGGLCLIIGEPGTGKSILKNAIARHEPKQWITPIINRSLHSWHNILRLLCKAFDLDPSGSDHKCEQRLIATARKLHSQNKTVIPIIDDAHLLPIEALRKLRLLLEDFPRSHNLILIGEPELNTTLQLRVNTDTKSRITYSARIDQLASPAIKDYIHSQLDRAGLPHQTFDEEAINLIIRSSEGVLRAVKNLCIGSMIEAVRSQKRTIGSDQVNQVLLQPHWRHNQEREPNQIDYKPGYPKK